MQTVFMGWKGQKSSVLPLSSTPHHVPDITPGGRHRIGARREVEDGWFLCLNHPFLPLSASSFPASAHLSGWLSFSTWKNSRRWNVIQGGGLGRGGGSCRSLRCPANGDGCGLKIVSRTASTMERERGEIHFSWAPSPGLQSSEEGAERSRLDLRGGRTAQREKTWGESEKGEWEKRRNDMFTTEEDGW